MQMVCLVPYSTVRKTEGTFNDHVSQQAAFKSSPPFGFLPTLVRLFIVYPGPVRFMVLLHFIAVVSVDATVAVCQEHHRYMPVVVKPTRSSAGYVM